MEYTSSDQDYKGGSHTHSEDEIIHVLDGSLQVGALRVEAGMSIAVPKDVRYGLRGDGSFRFLNYRRDVATFTGPPGSDTLVEDFSTLKSSLAVTPSSD